MADSDSTIDPLDVMSDPLSLASEPDPPCKKRHVSDEPGVSVWFCARMIRPFEKEVFQALTHVFIQGLMFQADTMTCIQTIDTTPWHNVKKRNPHLKMVWCCDRVFMDGPMLDKAMGTRIFWDQLSKLRYDLNADFIELNLESIPFRFAAIPPNWRDYLLLVLPNQPAWETFTFYHVMNNCTAATINAFGLLDKVIHETTHGRIENVKIMPDTNLQTYSNFIQTLFPFWNKILMGIDTQCVRYILADPASIMVTHFEIFERKTFLQELRTGHETEHGKRNYRYKHCPTEACHGSLFELRRNRVVVSADSFDDVVTKIKFAKDRSFQGVVVGGLQCDVQPLSKRSMFRAVFTHLMK